MADSMHVARKLATINVSPGAGTLQTALDNANAGDTLVLADGTYTGSGSDVLTISKDITIRAQNAGQAILDGENTRRVIKINSGTVVLEGLNITKGKPYMGGGLYISGSSTSVSLTNCNIFQNEAGYVSAHLLPFPGPVFHRPAEFTVSVCLFLASLVSVRSL